MTEDEINAAIEKAVEAATTALKAKNTELIGEIRNLKTAKTAAEEAAQEAEDAKALASNNVEQITNTLNAKHKKALDALIEERDAATAQLNTLLIDNTIQRTLVESNVAPHMHEPLTALFKTQAKLVDGRAMHGDVELTDHLKSYFAGDAGKHFVSAPNNSGGGAVGVKSAQAGHTFTKENFSQRLSEWMLFAKSDPAQAKAIAESVGRSDLANTV